MKTHEQIQGWYDWHRTNEWLVLNRFPQDGVYIECGVWKCKSLVAFGQLCQKYGKRAKLYGVDLFGGAQDDPTMTKMVREAGGSFYGEALRNLLDANVDAQLIRGDIDDTAAQFDDNFADMILIDGLHTYDAVSSNTLSWMPKLKRGGYMLWHDVDREEVRQAIKDTWGDFEMRKPRIGLAQKKG